MDAVYNDSYTNATVDEVVRVPRVTTFAFWTEGVVLTAVGVAGLAGNAVSLAVLSRPQMRSSMSCGLIALALFDTLLLLSSITWLGLQNLGHRVALLHRYAFEFFPFVAMVAYPVGLIAQTGSVWTTVGVTVERYVAVCHPLKARFLCTYRRALLFYVFIAAFSVCYNLPRFWEMEVVQVVDLDNANQTIYVAKPSDFRMNKLYYKVYHHWMYLLVMYFVPFASLAVLNGFIWRAVRVAGHRRRGLTGCEEKEELGLATLLVGVVTTFLVCNSPALVVNVLELFDIYAYDLISLTNLLVTINSSVNFVLYCIFGRKFKKVFLRMACGRCRRDKNRSFGSTLTHTEASLKGSIRNRCDDTPNGTKLSVL